MFCDERPSSAMSEMSINIHDGDYMSRAESRMEHFGDDISDGTLYSGHGHDDFEKDNASDIFKKKNLTLHVPQDDKEVNYKQNEDLGIKEEKISRKIEITAVTNKPQTMTSEKKQDSITPIDQRKPQKTSQKDESAESGNKIKTANNEISTSKQIEKPDSNSKPLKTNSLSS